MHKYDYSFLKDFKITSKLIGLSNIIYESNNKTKDLKDYYPELFFKLHEKAIIESTVSSNRIEGVKTSEKRQQELLIENKKPINHNEEEISGYKDAIVYITKNYNKLVINEKTIKELHRILMYYTQGEKGEYKKVDNEITANYEDGRKEILFKTVSYKTVDKNMKELVRAYKDANKDSEIDKTLLIPCFIIDFLAIHPFIDGNGRISRLLTLLLLYKHDYDIGKYISYEKMIEDYKWNYYEEINKSQISWCSNKNDYSPFIIFHFQMLYRCYGEMNKRLGELLNSKKISKKTRIEKTVLNSITPISKKEIQDNLPDVSSTTIEKVLSDLLKDNKIKKIGTYKNARYISNED